MHTSFGAVDDRDRFFAEHIALEAEIGASVRGARAHYLRFRYHETPAWAEAAGLEYEASLGWHDRPGFACGIARPFAPWIFGQERAAQIELIPLAVTDWSLWAELGLDATQDWRVRARCSTSCALWRGRSHPLAQHHARRPAGARVRRGLGAAPGRAPRCRCRRRPDPPAGRARGCRSCRAPDSAPDQRAPPPGCPDPAQARQCGGPGRGAGRGAGSSRARAPRRTDRRRLAPRRARATRARRSLPRPRSRAAPRGALAAAAVPSPGRLRRARVSRRNGPDQTVVAGADPATARGHRQPPRTRRRRPLRRGDRRQRGLAARFALAGARRVQAVTNAPWADDFPSRHPATIRSCSTLADSHHSGDSTSCAAPPSCSRPPVRGSSSPDRATPATCRPR